MSDLERRLTDLDDLDVSDVLERARMRASTGPLPYVDEAHGQGRSGIGRFGTIVVAFAVFAAGATLLVRSVDDRTPPGPAIATPSETPRSTASLLEIDCRRDGASVTPAVVELGPTGIDVRVSNPAGEEFIYMRHPDRIGRSIGLEIGHGLERRGALEVPPGPWIVDCFSGAFSTFDVPASAYSASFEIIDPDGNLAIMRDARTCGEPLIEPASGVDLDSELVADPVGTLFVEAALPDGGTQVSTVPLDGGEPSILPLPDLVWRVDVDENGLKVVYELFDDADGDPTFTDASREDSELYTSNLDGTEVHRLTDNRNADYVARWKPGGEQISFMSNRGGPIRTYVMDSDGSNVRPLLPEGWQGGDHAWSPDGSKLAFLADAGIDEGDGCRYDNELYVMDADGSNVVRLTDDEWYTSGPDVSPDGSRIAFSASNQSDEEHDVMVINVDGSGLTRLTDAPGYDGQPAWSPDGQLIVFESTRALPGEQATSSTGRLFIMNADGSGQRLVFGPGSRGYVEGSSVSAFAWLP